MSSSLLNNVPVLTGTANFREWQPQMRSFLMANGLWLKMQRTPPSVRRSREVTTVIAAVPTDGKCQCAKYGHKILLFSLSLTIHSLHFPFLMPLRLTLIVSAQNMVTKIFYFVQVSPFLHFIFPFLCPYDCLL